MQVEMDVNTGMIHKNQGLLCQDVVAYRKDESHITVVLCDGAGCFSKGREAAGLVSECVAELLHKKYKLYLYCNSDWIRQEVACEIKRKLTGKAKENGINEKEYACTMIAVSMGKDGNFVCLHLGDGRVLMKSDKDSFYLVSSPINGANKNETFLTMNCDMEDYFQVYQCHSRTEQLLLWTDGMEETMKSRIREVKHGEFIFDIDVGKELLNYVKMLTKIPEDDYSICSILLNATV